MSKLFDHDEYVKPRCVRISRTKRTEKLYRLEAQRNTLIDMCAHELAAVLGIPRHEFWRHSLPLELFSLLDSYDFRAAEVAAIGFLEFRGYAVTSPELVKESEDDE